MDKKVDIIRDADGKSIVVINDLRFKGRRSVDWNIVENCLKEYIGQCAEIIETSDIMLYIGADFPDEFVHSKDTKELRGANMYAKANSSSVIREMIEIATNKTFAEREMIADLEKDIAHLDSHTPPDKEHFSMTVLGTVFTEKKEAGQALIAAFDSLKDLNDKVELGEYRGFPMTLWVSDTGFSQKLQITLKHERSHTIEPGIDPFGNITRLDNLLDGIRENLGQHKEELENLLQQTEEAKVEVKRPFPQEAELAEKSERLSVLNVALNIGGKEKPRDKGERQARDGKTSIKRLLHRMGVESAASAAAPRKEKDMEVTIG